MKTGRFNIRLESHIRKALWLIAEKDHRSVTNMMELLIMRECAVREIDIDELRDKDE